MDPGALTMVIHSCAITRVIQASARLALQGNSTDIRCLPHRACAPASCPLHAASLCPEGVLSGIQVVLKERANRPPAASGRVHQEGREESQGSCEAGAGGACGAASDPRTQESLPAPDRLSPRQEGQGPRARGQRWVRCSRASEAGCLPDRGILFRAAVRVPKATPGGHDGNDSRSSGLPSRRLSSLARTRAVLRGGQAPLRGEWGGRVQKGTPKILPSKGLGTEVGSQGESPSDSKCTGLSFMASFPHSGFLAFFFL